MFIKGTESFFYEFPHATWVAGRVGVVVGKLPYAKLVSVCKLNFRYFRLEFMRIMKNVLYLSEKIQNLNVYGLTDIFSLVDVLLV